MKQNNENTQRGRDHGLDDGIGDRADRALNQRCAVVKRHDANAVRQADPQLVYLGLDAARDFEWVFPMSHQDHAAGDFVAVFLEDASAEAGAERDIGNLGEPDRASPGQRYNHVFQVAESAIGAESLVARRGRRTQPTHTAHHVLGVPLVDDVAARRGIRRCHGVDNVFEQRTPKARSRLGSGITWYSIGKPPTLETSATPGTEPSWGRTYQSWIARSRPRSKPAPSTVYQKICPVAAASGVSSGLAPAGSWL